MTRCLYCYQEISGETPTDGEADFHPKCSKKIFGLNKPPVLSFGKNELKEIAQQFIIRSVTITGVQPKLSLAIEKIDAQNSRLTIVGLWGNFILKPPTEQFSNLPENEDLTMKLASICGILTAEHTLIRLQSGELAYLTKRFDRTKNSKIHVEDLCQLTETLTEHKYRSSMEKTGKAIRKFSTNSGFDVLVFFELTIFCFLTGNADMHLKNFSLMRIENGNISFAPAYDLLSTKLAMPEDNEQMALTINGKKNRLKKHDFDKLAESLAINPITSERVYNKFQKQIIPIKNMISESFLSEEMKMQYIDLIEERLDILMSKK
ncbi:MAG: HipA domain-containing protein [Emticicia sp.]